MNLRKKKSLAARTFNVGEGRISFVKSRLDEIKEAITKQDIRDLQKNGAIIIKEKKGRRKVTKNKSRSPGNIKKKVNKRKKEYVIITRKLRKYVGELKKQGKISSEDSNEIRKKIRNREFRSKSHLKENIGELK
ncbi:MAG: 50S ribosomal protein L19e [Candidatus Pacearchaeota archaeon]